MTEPMACAESQRVVKAGADTLTDLERSAGFVYFHRTEFARKDIGQNRGVSTTRSAAFDIT